MQTKLKSPTLPLRQTALTMGSYLYNTKHCWSVSLSVLSFFVPTLFAKGKKETAQDDENRPLLDNPITLPSTVPLVDLTPVKGKGC